MDLHCQLLVIAFMLPSAPGDLKSNSSSPENSTFSSLDAAANFTNQMRAANVTSRGQPGELHPFEYACKFRCSRHNKKFIIQETKEKQSTQLLSLRPLNVDQ
ncbi:uncharacterized protein LOC114667652 isoform X3 [Erpetoichthys calabaricus]|uniref:uncharacterized protein LOC114667652 isoform X3 n=1 Tax=Erpetoichthys calabaricus TaxID=27687 RepID=UPI00223405DC|nr:uncharacterized protein LOC114667652 isoform X3 [Erpetoichthys calabaricus]